MSAKIRDMIAVTGKATVYLDLLPNKDIHHIVNEIAHPRGSRSMSSHLQSRLESKGKSRLTARTRVKTGFSDPAN